MKRLLLPLFCLLTIPAVTFGATDAPTQSATQMIFEEPARHWVDLEKMILEADVMSQGVTIALTPAWVAYAYLSGDCKVQLPLWETALLAAGYPVTCEGLLDYWSERGGHQFIFEAHASTTAKPTDAMLKATGAATARTETAP